MFNLAVLEWVSFIMQWFPIQRPCRTLGRQAAFQLLGASFQCNGEALQWRGPDTKRRLGGNPRDKKETRLTAGWWKDFMFKSIQQWLSKLWHEMPFRFRSLVGRNFKYHLCMQFTSMGLWKNRKIINSWKKHNPVIMYFWPWVAPSGCSWPNSYFYFLDQAKPHKQDLV